MNDISIGMLLLGLALMFFGLAAMCAIEQAVKAFKAWRGK